MKQSAERACVRQLVDSFGAAECTDQPFRHWVVSSVLPAPVVEAIRGLPMSEARLVSEDGRRATQNDTRTFCTEAVQRQHPVWAELAESFQHPLTIAAIERCCGTSLAGTFLRIEYSVDREGFWLEPNTNIDAKRFTMMTYLSDELGSEAWGTDLLYVDGSLARRMRAVCNTALMFIPGTDTWHAFASRPFNGVRRCLIVNYVGPEWRARHELAFPDRPVSVAT